MIVDVALKVTALLAAAWIASSLLRGRAASTRHAVWIGTLMAALALPAMASLTPRVELAWLPAPSMHRTRNAAEPTPPPALNVSRTTSVSPAPRSAVRESIAIPVASGRTPMTPTLSASQLAFSIWAVGALLLLLRTAAAHISARRALRRCVTAPEPLVRALESVAEDLDIRTPALAIAPSGTMPAVAGVLRATVLLPADAMHWSAERLRVVLLHECAHVQRRDGVLQLVASVATASYWWHPLTWLAAKRTVRERELACDDLVLAKGTPGPAYAQHLVDIARSVDPSRRHAAAALAMARPSELEGRLIALLENRPRQTRPTRALTLGVLVAGLGVACLAPLTLVARSQTNLQPEVAATAASNDARPSVDTVSTEARTNVAVASEPPTLVVQQDVRPSPSQTSLTTALTRALDDEDEEVRTLALTALVRSGSSDAVPVLVRALDDESADMRAFALINLIRLKQDEARRALPKALDDSSGDVRAIGVIGLTRIGHPDRHTLALAAALDTDDDVRALAALALAGEPGEDVDAALVTLSEDVSADVRRAALIAIAKRTVGAPGQSLFADSLAQGLVGGLAAGGIAEAIAGDIAGAISGGIAGLLSDDKRIR